MDVSQKFAPGSPARRGLAAWLRRARASAGPALGATLIALGVIVCAGWYLRLARMVQVIPASAPMQFNTALLFLSAGLGLLALHYERPRAVLLAAALGAGLAALTLAQYLSGGDYGVDRVFVEPFLSSQTSHPGRMAPNTALAFLLAFACLALVARGSCYVGALLASLVVALGAMALLGYLFDLAGAYGWGQLTRMAVHTAAAFTLLGIGLLLESARRAPSGRVSDLPWLGPALGIGMAALSLLGWQALHAEFDRSVQQQLQLREQTIVEPAVGTRLADLLLLAGLGVAILLALAVAQAEKLNRRTRELAKLNAALERESHALAVTNENLEQFAYSLSHDIKAPIRAIVGFTQILERRIADATPARILSMTQELRSTALDLAQMLEAILELARVGHVQRENLREVPARAVVDAGLARLKTLIDERGARLAVGELPVIRTEPALLAQVWQNLVGNAIKYQPGGQPYVGIAAEAADGGWIFSVRDHGPGIDPLQQEDIFKLFHRGAAADRVEGTGIGLAIVRRIITALGGRVWVESTPGQGATFKFFLPREIPGVNRSTAAALMHRCGAAVAGGDPGA